MKDLFLLVIALLLFPLLLPINLMLVKFQGGSMRGYFRSTAVSIDRFASGEYRTLWNTIFIKKHFGHKFNGDYTISYYLGKNEHFGTLSFFGEFFVYLLDIIDKNHCKKAYEHFEGKIK
jgi:hypothetical protein